MSLQKEMKTDDRADGENSLHFGPQSWRDAKASSPLKDVQRILFRPHNYSRLVRCPVAAESWHHAALKTVKREPPSDLVGIAQLDKVD